jgi:RHS repeat-associated protein
MFSTLEEEGCCVEIVSYCRRGVLAKYDYDNLGRRTALTRGNGTTTGNQYDGTPWLTELTHNLAATAADQTLGMTYTPAGQISTRTSSNDSYSWTEDQNLTRSYTVNSLDQYDTVGGVSLTYDARGNLTNGGLYGYSSENLLTSAPGFSLSYDPVRRLNQISSSAGTTRFAYDGDQLAAEYNASNQLLRRYVHGATADEPLVWYEGSGTATRRWLHADERGSIIAISDASGAQFGINRYDEHGMPATDNMGRFQFTGQAWIAEAKLYYFKARFYSASLGRFMQTDPMGYAAGMNMYAYVRGDVINMRDPTGLMNDGMDDIGGVIGSVTTTATRYCDLLCDPTDIYNCVRDQLIRSGPTLSRSFPVTIRPVMLVNMS